MKNCPFLRKHHTEETRRKMRENHADFNGSNNPNFKFNISKNFLLQKYVEDKKSEAQIAKEFDCSASTIHNNLLKYSIRRRTTAEALKGKIRPDISKRMKGRKRPDASERMRKNNPIFKRGYICKGNGAYYKNIWMRSTWEIKFARFLDLSGYKWFYEPKRFNLKNTTYTPDFYIPIWDLYIEIKGYKWKSWEKKFNLFKRLYPKVRIKVFSKKKLEILGIDI